MHVEKNNIIETIWLPSPQGLGVALTSLSSGREEKAFFSQLARVQSGALWGRDLRNREEAKQHTVGKNSMNKYLGIRMC